MTPEEMFVQKTGMSVEQAWKKILEWKEKNEMAKVEQGVALILQFFPNHEAKNLCVHSENIFGETPKEEKSENIVEQKLEDKLEEKTVATESETPQKPKKSASKNMTLSETFQFILTGKKPLRLEKKLEEETDELTETENLPKKSVQKVAAELAKPEKPVVSSEKMMQMSGVSFEKAKQVDPSLPDENEVLDDERMFAAIAYIPFLSFFTLFSRKDSAFVQFHSWQAFSLLVIFLGSLFPYFLLHFLPGFSFLFWLFYLLFFGVLALCFATAWKGRYISLPFISDFARRFAGKKTAETEEN